MRRDGGSEAMGVLLNDWERWSAEVLESHISYPVLAFYRSQHDNQSWVAALTTILDTCALVISGIQGVPPREARLTFAMARHALGGPHERPRRSSRAPTVRTVFPDPSSRACTARSPRAA